MMVVTISRLDPEGVERVREGGREREASVSGRCEPAPEPMEVVDLEEGEGERGRERGRGRGRLRGTERGRLTERGRERDREG